MYTVQFTHILKRKKFFSKDRPEDTQQQKPEKMWKKAKNERNKTTLKMAIELIRIEDYQKKKLEENNSKTNTKC